jgi:transcriptional regulator with XRE-family HTH domain
MVTVEQIKAARGLISWTQLDLARAARISEHTLKNIERKSAKPRYETQQIIQKTLEAAGIEFIEDIGVKLRGESLKVQVWEGSESLFRLLADIYETLSGTDKELMICGVDEKVYLQTGGERFLAEVKKRLDAKIRTKLLSADGDTNYVEPYEHYRWVSREIFNQMPYYVYDNKYAILLWGTPQRVVLVENKAIADGYRRQFMALWNNAKIPFNPEK